MKKSVMIIAICAVIAFIPAISLNAQTIYVDGVGDLESNTSKATAGLFTNDVDDYMSVHDYADVLTDGAKWFSFISGKTYAGGVLDTGYARTFGGIYVGAWFRGNLYRTRGASNYETKTITPTYDDALGILTERKDTITYQDAWDESANNLEFLIGVKGMGIKVGFYESVATNKNKGAPVVPGYFWDNDDDPSTPDVWVPPTREISVTDYLDGRKDYENAVDSYTNSKSYWKPYIGWGGSFNLGKMKINPFANIGFGIYSDKLIDKYRSYTEINGVKQNVVTSVGAGHNEEYNEPQVEVGAWLDLPQKGAAQTSVGLSYGLNMKMYNSGAEGLGSVGGTVSWDDGFVNRETKYTDRTVTETDMTYNINSQSYMEHTIAPAFKITGEPAENFKVGFMAAVPVSFSSESSKNYSKQIEKTKVKYNMDIPGYVREEETITYNDNTSTSTFSIGVDLSLGASYQLIPGRFGINAGISATPTKYNHSAVKTIPNSVNTVHTVKVTQDDGTVTTNDKTVTLGTHDDEVTVTDGWSQYTAKLGGGFTFNFNSKAAVDFAVSGGTFSDNTFNLNIADVNLIFTLKF